MTNEEKIIALEEMMDLERGSITSDTMLSDLEDWDSVAFLSFIALLDDEFDKQIQGSVIRQQKTVGDLMRLMEKE